MTRDAKSRTSGKSGKAGKAKAHKDSDIVDDVSAEKPRGESAKPLSQGKQSTQTKPVHDLSKKEVDAERTRLADEISRHDNLYHGKDDPEISDAAYDALVIRLREIEEAFPAPVDLFSPTQSVGAPPIQGFAKVRHARPMLSLNNAFKNEDIEDFALRIRKFLSLGEDDALAFTAEPKIDGLSLSLRYEEGKLTQAATRGDGAEGENVTANVLAAE